jgi:putative ABC transport system permease protein
MFNNYFKIAWRNLLKDRQFTLLNWIGLSTSLACALLIWLWVLDEIKVDKFHANDKRLYQVMANDRNSSGISTTATTNSLLARTLKVEMPEVEYAAGSLDLSWYGHITLSEKENNISAIGHFADQDFFNVFSYTLLHGNKDRVLADKHSIVLSESTALKLFHRTDNVIGKSVTWQHETTYLVSGIFADPPSYSTDRFDYVLPLDAFIDQNTYQKNWGQSSDPATYVVLKQGAKLDQFNKKIAGFMKTKYTQSTEILFGRPYSAGYLYGKYENGLQSGGRIEYVRLFSIIAIFILVIACINFMNLSTAKASKRMKEVGVRKVMGAGRGSLIAQYLGESMLLTLVSLITAIILTELLLPEFNAITGKELSLHFSAELIMAIAGITLFTGFLSGSYPALYLSSFNPVVVLKGRLSAAFGEVWIRKGLVVFQFALSVIFIISVLVVYRQLQFIQHKNLGFNKDNVLNFDMTGISAQNTNSFLSEVKNIPGVVNASSMDHSNLYDFGGSVPFWEGMNPKQIIEIKNIGINYNLIETMGLHIIKGRAFSRAISSDSSEVILNQAAIAAMGIKDPLGKKIEIFGGDGNRTIVGIVQDFHFESLHETVKPFALRLVPQYIRGIMVKTRGGTERQTIDQLAQLYSKYHPGFPFEYHFVDEDFQQQYVAEKRVGTLSRWFGGLAILISCLGLFGLAAFTAERRFKEIGIRKVLGASAVKVVVLLSADFLKLALLAVLIAFPLSWWAANQWLNAFPYRIHPGTDIFLIAGFGILVITLLTISFQVLKAAWANPAKSLKAE